MTIRTKSPRTHKSPVTTKVVENSSYGTNVSALRGPGGMWRALFYSSIIVFSATTIHVEAAEKPEEVAADFCRAVAAQARCTKIFKMPVDTEARMEKLAGSKLRGEGELLDSVCKESYSKYYSLEDSEGKAKACQITLSEFGPEGSRRAGLVVPVIAPKLKLPENEVGQIATDFCYATSVVRFCSGLSLSESIEEKLSAETGAALSRPGVGYFSSECGTGAFRAGLAKGKVPLEEFCATSLAAYGDKGSKRAGLIYGELPSRPSVASVTPATSDNDKLADKRRLILTEVPDLAAGQTPASLFGGVPATYSKDECAQLRSSVLQAQTRYSSATSLAKEIRAAIHLKAGSLAANALCPGSTKTQYTIDTLSKVQSTGLEACHIVMKTVKEIDKLSKGFRDEKSMRGVLAVSEAKVWSLKEFLPTCSELTQRQMESSLKFSEQSLQRDQKNIVCRIWYDAFRGTTKTVRALQKDKKWDEAFTVIDSKAVAAIHGMTATCEQASYAENAIKGWVSSRKNLQQRALR